MQQKMTLVCLLPYIQTPVHPPPPSGASKTDQGVSKSAATVSRAAVHSKKPGDAFLVKCPGGICCPPEWAERSSRSTWGLANTNRVGDQHGIKTKIPHQIRSCSIDTKVSVQVPQGMGYEVMQQAERGC